MTWWSSDPDSGGLGQLTHALSPLLKITFRYLRQDPRLITRWIKMYFRYYQNWYHNVYDYRDREAWRPDPSQRPKIHELIFKKTVEGLDGLLRVTAPVIKSLEACMECACCWYVCNADAILFAWPKGGAGYRSDWG